MTVVPLTGQALELLARGHALYAGQRVEASVPAPLLSDVGARSAPQFTMPAIRRMAAGLRRAAAADAVLTTVLADAATQHAQARHHTRTVLDAAHADSMPAVDTPVGRREFLRRTAARLRLQRQHIQRSRRHARILTRQLRRLRYPRRLPSEQRSRAAAIPLAAVRFERAYQPGRVRARIGAALDRLGIVDPGARRNWLRGYETLIARESGGRPSAVASEPATQPGPVQADGHRLGYARGLTQTIPATFARYHQPGTSTNIYDPIANICASINYVMRRYGVGPDGANLAALVQQADPHRPPKGY
ncbi:hypothetical protein A5707_21580 [Mycobacterium kyorinense]|uniref:Transglycosylase SLT domain-containing protein n=1 Tax=Mycobacterium kyorinense TaxID=487514 RepID=A0A1A2ZA96_9MYCO|nr:transglycosylase SLT domain-containing protein [Mycobacterium kyorinense]OBI46417.1 hypothetical protein A5707_21580 [Mycobacterium kyorinense]